jgi:3-hydroxyacyl-CoA dehydrogenase
LTLAIAVEVVEKDASNPKASAKAVMLATAMSKATSKTPTTVPAFFAFLSI